MSGGIAALVDISERKQAEARQRVLVYELQHRVKNIIATISALAVRTLRKDAPAEEFAEDFLGRLRGMAATHELLSRDNWSGSPLRELIEAAVGGHASPEGPRLIIDGPSVLMTSNATATLGMVFYELTTNAVKYGALDRPGGRIDISWSVETTPVERVALTWTEAGGQPLKSDAVPGFGTMFVRRSIEYELQGVATLEPMSDGLRWRLEFPTERNVQRA